MFSAPIKHRTKKYAIKQQAGATVVTMALLMAACTLFIYGAIKLTPVYIENYQANKVMDAFYDKSRGDFALWSNSRIRREFFNHLAVHNIEYIKKSNLKMKSDTGVVRLFIAYDVRIPMFKNIDFMLSFTREYEVITH